MSEEQKTETKDQAIDERTLREKDPREWKARKVKRQAQKNRIRDMAKANGLKLGRWRGSVAFVKRAPVKTTFKKLVTRGKGDAGRFPGYADVTDSLRTAP